jgi:hypothetical protein
MKPNSLTTLAWVFANALLLSALFGLETDINFFSWNPKWGIQTIGYIAGIPAVIVFHYFITRATRQRTTCIIALSTSLLVMALAFFAAQPEPHGTGWLARTASSPGWYRWGRVLVCYFPFLISLWVLRRVMREKFA